MGELKITDNLIQMIKSLRNIKFIFTIQLFIVVADFIYWGLLPRGYEKDVSIGVLFGLMLSVIVQLLLLTIKPELYGNKSVENGLYSTRVRRNDDK